MPDNVLDIASFYDHLAPDYDQMTGFEGRFVREGPPFKALVENHGIGTALDAGCGTGFHSLLLARLGVTVTAVDLSEVMLEKLRVHADGEGLSIATVRSSFQELQRTLETSFDGLFCMGNALAHLLTVEDLRLALGNFSALLKPGGIFVFQVLNFERILAQRPRVLSVKTAGATVYTRYYEYVDPLIRFNITKSTERNVQPDEVITTILRPVLWKELSFMLGDAGFENVKCFGSISMTEYAPATSQDLLVLASKKLKPA
ncbi:MAG: putative methyltransferase [Bacteroidetes bacterium]|nr:putative methyltransferase [Bacteroidota bacterium]